MNRFWKALGFTYPNSKVLLHEHELKVSTGALLAIEREEIQNQPMGRPFAAQKYVVKSQSGKILRFGKFAQTAKKSA